MPHVERSLLYVSENGLSKRLARLRARRPSRTLRIVQSRSYFKYSNGNFCVNSLRPTVVQMYVPPFGRYASCEIDSCGWVPCQPTRPSPILP